MNDTVYLLYEGDSHLSKNSMVLMGVFSSPETLKQNAEELVRERAKEHLQHAKDNGYNYDDEDNSYSEDDVVDDIMVELMSRHSTCGWETNYSIQEVTLDKLEEI